MTYSSLMVARFLAVALGLALASCAQARSASSPSPAPAPKTAAASPSTSPSVAPSASPFTLSLDGSNVLSSGKHVADTTHPNLDRQLEATFPEAAGDHVFRLEVSKDSTYEHVTTLLQATTRRGWPQAKLVTTVDTIDLQLAEPTATAALPHLLLWPKLAHVGVLAPKRDASPVNGLTEIPFPYGLDLAKAAFCKQRSCERVQVLAEPTLAFFQVAGPLHLLARAQGGAVRAHLVAGPMPPPGTPAVKVAETTLGGRLPPETIRAVVREAYDRFRSCYQAGLAKDPKLTGKVVVRFVIGRDGRVSNVSLASDLTTLPDGDVTTCVMREYFDLIFPEPEGGVVTVVYPIMFSPEE